MMIAMVAKGQHSVDDAKIIVHTSGITCIIVDQIDPDKFSDFKRISIEEARKLCFKTSAKWRYPDNSSDGRKLFDNLFKEWIQNLSFTGDIHDIQTSRKTSNFVTVSSNGRKGKSLIDIQEMRQRRRKWQ